MNEELQKALASLLGKANDGIDTASDFLVAELPDVIQQLLMWYGVYSFVMFLIGATTLLLIKKTATRCATVVSDAKQDRADGAEWTKFSHSNTVSSAAYDSVGMIYAIPIIQFIVGMCFITLEWLQIWIAPKVWLIEYAAKLAN